jgi:hypothetical protein
MANLQNLHVAPPQSVAGFLEAAAQFVDGSRAQAVEYRKRSIREDQDIDEIILVSLCATIMHNAIYGSYPA